MGPGGAGEVWIGTRKGVFLATRDVVGHDWTINGPGLAGYEVYHVATDPGSPHGAFAAANHPVWGTHVFRTMDGGDTWSMQEAPEFPAGVDREVRALWHLAYAPTAPGLRPRWYAGVDPGGVFVTEDPETGWRFLPGLEEHPTRGSWQVAKGGMPLHSIQIDPRNHDRIYVAVSAGGCYRTEDAGGSWTPINQGVRAEYLTDPASPAGHNPHALRIHPLDPDRLYRQDHCGVYVSRDRGDTWKEITDGLPSEFGYGLALDPSDPDRAWVIPEESSHMRCVCAGRLRVYETGNAGATWKPRTQGLPQQHAYVSILRDGLSATTGLVAFGTTTGQVYVSEDGEVWEALAALFPTVLSIALRP